VAPVAVARLVHGGAGFSLSIRLKLGRLCANAVWRRFPSPRSGSWSAPVRPAASGEIYRLAGGNDCEKRLVRIALSHTAGQSTRDEGSYVLLAHFQKRFSVINQELYEFIGRRITLLRPPKRYVVDQVSIKEVAVPTVTESLRSLDILFEGSGPSFAIAN